MLALIHTGNALYRKDANRYVKKHNKQIMPKVCPMDEHTKRETMKEQIFLWQKDIPTITSQRIINLSITNIFSNNFLFISLTQVYFFLLFLTHLLINGFN